MPATTRGLPSTRPRTKSGKDFGLTSPPSTSTKARVAFLSASGEAANPGSIAPGPRPGRRAMAFWVSGLAGSVQDLISVISLSARKLVKKLIHPFRKGTPAPLPRANLPPPIRRDISAQAQTHPTRRAAPHGPPVGNIAELCHRLGSGRRGPVHACRGDRHPGNPLQSGIGPAHCRDLPMADDSTLNAVRSALEAFVDPYLQETLGGAGAIRDLVAQGDGYHARIALGYPVGGYREELTAA